jgi:fructose-1-phosphate kinase PfkB-like protein
VIGASRYAGIFVADVLDEEQDQDVVLGLAGVHAATEFVAARPERGIKFRFLERHSRRHPAM